jgi:predicted ribosome quality control (RQC) complex YloA/Tae2 family protein
MKRKQESRLVKALRTISILLLLLLLFNFIKDLSLTLVSINNNINKLNYKLHTLENEIVKLKYENKGYNEIIAHYEKRLDQLEKQNITKTNNELITQEVSTKEETNEHLLQHNDLKKINNIGWISVLVGVIGVLGKLVLRVPV